MKKLFFILCLLPSLLWAAPIGPNIAQQVAENFINAPQQDANGVLRAPQKRKKMAKVSKQVTNDQQFYIFNSENYDGFVIVSADDVVKPILGYSINGAIDTDNMPENLRWWLSEYNRQIRWAQENGIGQSEEIAAEWDKMRTAQNLTAATPVVSPLITSHWDQQAPYNNQCPIYNGTDRAATGCVATATAQIMNFWKYPSSGSGNMSYTTTTRGLQLSANFANSTYDWNNMLNEYSYYEYNPSSDTPEYGELQVTNIQKSAVAKLMSDVGIACRMDYAQNGDESASDNLLAGKALFVNFDYDRLIYLTKRDLHSETSWIFMLIQQLKNGYPVLYQGRAIDENGNKLGGHSFICDGYNSVGYFHFNWGWSSIADGYYYLGELSPTETGTGASYGNYTYYQEAVVDIFPNTNSNNYNLQLISDINISNETLFYGQPFTISIDIINAGSLPFEGNIYAAIKCGDEIVLIDSLVNTTLEEELPILVSASPTTTNTTNILFENDGYLNLESGTCSIAFIYEDINGNIGSIGGDYFMNVATIDYEHSFQLTPGKYVIVANRDKAGDKNWYYMTSDLGTASTKRFQAVTTGVESMDAIVITNLEDKYVWTLEADGDNWKLKNGTQYVTWISGNSANLGSTAKSLTFDIAENMVLAHFTDGSAERYLSLNATTNNNYFAFYSGTNQVEQLYFLPYDDGSTPVDPQPESDRYVILAQRNASSNWFYMTSDLGTASNKRYQAVDAGTSTLSEISTKNLEDKYYWEIEENKLKTGTQYSTWTSGNTANLDATGKELTIQQQTDGTYTFSFVDGADTRYLALNATAGNDYFAYYKGTNQIYRLTLVKEGGNGSTVGVENIVEQPSATKVLMNGQILILRGDKTYTLTGQEVK